MAKKRFSEGLDGLFTDALDEKIDKDPFLGSTVVAEKEKRVRSERRRGRKNFTSDLDSLLESSMNEIHEREQKKEKRPDSDTSSHKRKRRYKKPLRGLNALIRQTLEPDFYEIEDDKKRVTFIYRKSKYKKLKKIAKKENIYLKDIIGKVLTKYIEMYEAEKGKLN